MGGCGGLGGKVAVSIISPWCGGNVRFVLHALGQPAVVYARRWDPRGAEPVCWLWVAHLLLRGVVGGVCRGRRQWRAVVRRAEAAGGFGWRWRRGALVGGEGEGEGWGAAVGGRGELLGVGWERHRGGCGEDCCRVWLRVVGMETGDDEVVRNGASGPVVLSPESGRRPEARMQFVDSCGLSWRPRCGFKGRL